MESCFIGIKTRNKCHEKWYHRTPGLKSLASLSAVEMELVALRSGASISNQEILSSSICSHHHAYYLRKFSKVVSKNCCDIFEIHSAKNQKAHVQSHWILLKQCQLHFLASCLATSYVQHAGKSLKYSQSQALPQ